MLNDLAKKYGTDKQDEIHGFASIYEKYFLPFKDEEFKLLEFGVKKGASLRMWEEFFPSAFITGIDNRPETMFETPRIEVVISDEVHYEPSCPQRIIIDDGSHNPINQVAIFENCFEHVEPGGFYVIEDIHTSYYPKYIEVPHILKYLCWMMDEMHFKGHLDDTGNIAGNKKWHLSRCKGHPLLSYYALWIKGIYIYRGIAIIEKEERKPR